MRAFIPVSSDFMWRINVLIYGALFCYCTYFHWPLVSSKHTHEHAITWPTVQLVLFSLASRNWQLILYLHSGVAKNVQLTPAIMKMNMLKSRRDSEDQNIWTLNNHFMKKMGLMLYNGDDEAIEYDGYSLAKVLLFLVTENSTLCNTSGFYRTQIPVQPMLMSMWEKLFSGAELPGDRYQSAVRHILLDPWWYRACYIAIECYELS